MVTKRPYSRIATFYDLLDLPFEYGRYRPLRRMLFEGAEGTVLDAGVGTGRNMPFYPPKAEVVGIDLSSRMLEQAERRRSRHDARVALRQMDVTRTDFPDRHFDHVVATFLFCVLDDDLQLPALAELRRILKPDGEIRLLEYTYSEDPLRRLVMRFWAPWVRLLYGATFDRRTERYVDDAGLVLVEDRFVVYDIIKLLVLRQRQKEDPTEET
ncbi:MAG: class I SAM-dependent methyltransferase [Alphaproteobacteria bacterium]|jgi:ubiquinone/menaquinone biosynthesis C-methylase UbiE|nr:class I SAM-dependent methyltransferase [Alphaproteobacteria bacterium]